MALKFLVAILAVVCSASALSSASPDEALRLFHDADQAENNNQFQEANDKFSQALALYEKAKDKKGIADTLYRLAGTNNILSRFKESLPILERAQKLHSELKDRKAMAFDITELAKTHMLIGDDGKGLELASQAMEIHKSLNNREGIVATFQVMGNCYMDQGKTELALETANQALNLATEIGDELSQGKASHLLGYIHKYKGDSELSLKYYEQSTAIYNRLGRRSLLADSYVNIGTVYSDLGDIPKSLEFYRKSIAVFEEIGDQYGIAVATNNIGVTHFRMGEYEKAREAFQREYDISIKTSSKEGQTLALSNLGYTSTELGNYEAALDFYKQALQLTQETKDQWSLAGVLGGLASCYENLGKFSTALEYYKKAYEVAEQSEFKMLQASNLMMIGVMSWKSGKTESVLPDLEKSAALLEALGTQYLLAENFYWTGSVQYSKQNMKEAEDALLKSIEIANDIGYVYSLSPALHKLALLYRDTARKEEAVQNLVKAADVIEGSRKELRTAEQRTGFFQSKVDVYDDLVALLVSLNRIDQAFEYVQRSKARGFVDMIAEAQIDPEKYLSADLRSQKKKLSSNLMLIHNQIEEETEKENTDKQKLRELVRKRNDLETQLTNLVLEIRKQNPEYAELQYPKPLTLTEAQAMLDGRTVLLEFYARKSANLLFVVSKTEAHVFTLPKTQKLREEISRFREALLKPDPAYNTIHQSYAQYAQLSQRLYQQLVAPAQQLIKGKSIILAPDGPLNYLPFESLLTGKTNLSKIDFSKLPYLARNYQISYVSSASVLSSVLQRRRQHSPGGQKQLLAVADPLANPNASPQESANARRANSLAPLEYARAEVEEISKLYQPKDVTVLIGADASESKVKQMDLNLYRALHFASHALIDEQHPEFSSLVLSPDDKGKEDGYLTMREIFDLKFNAELVVLSACKTGLGKEFSGEGLSGISRAFLLSGTPSVIVSLWDVYDRSTAMLMAAFYKNRKNGKTNKAAAMKQARMELINSGKFSHPYYWSPFILIGSN